MARVPHGAVTVRLPIPDLREFCVASNSMQKDMAVKAPSDFE
jgi:hypothetical protein